MAKDASYVNVSAQNHSSGLPCYFAVAVVLTVQGTIKWSNYVPSGLA